MVALIGTTGCAAFPRGDAAHRVPPPGFSQTNRATSHGFHRTTWHASPAQRTSPQRLVRRSPSQVNEQAELTAPDPQDSPTAEVVEMPSRIIANVETAVAETAPTVNPFCQSRYPSTDSEPVETHVAVDIDADNWLAARAATLECVPRHSASTERFDQPRMLPEAALAREVKALKYEHPLTLHSAPASWSNRYRTLLAADRKTRWRELRPSAAKTALTRPQAVEQQQDAASIVRTALVSEPPTANAVEEVPPKTATGDASLQLRTPHSALCAPGAKCVFKEQPAVDEVHDEAATTPAE